MDWITNNSMTINFVSWFGLMVATFLYDEYKETIAQGILALLGIISFLILGFSIVFNFFDGVTK